MPANTSGGSPPAVPPLVREISERLVYRKLGTLLGALLVAVMAVELLSLAIVLGRRPVCLYVPEATRMEVFGIHEDEDAEY